MIITTVTMPLLRRLCLCCILLAPPAGASFVRQAEEHCRWDLPLAAVLSGDEARPLNLSYSSRMVTGNMRALGSPAGPFEERLSHWLSVYGLELRQSGEDEHLVVRAEHPPELIIGQVLETRGQPLPNAEVRVRGTDVLTHTSASGCFVLTAQDGDQRLTIRAEGFQDRSFTVESGSWHRFELQAEIQQPLETVVVAGTSYQMMGASLSSQSYLNREQIEKTPHLGDDITRAFRHLSGAASGDISPKLNVRGGSKNETAMVIDGLTLHQPWYFKSLDGLVSIVDSNIISSVDFLSGGFTSEYGGKTSALSIIDTLSADQAPSMVGLSFMTAYGQAGGSFAREVGSWLASVRGGYLDIAFGFAGVEGKVEPRYQDMFAKFDFALGDHTQATFNLLGANDHITFNTGEGVDQELVDDTSSNYNLWVHAETAPSDILNVVSTFFLTDSEFRLWGQYDRPKLHWWDERYYRAWGVQSDWTAIPHDDHLFKWGVDLKWLEAEYDYYLFVQVLPGDDNPMGYIDRRRQAILSPKGKEQSGYLSYRFRWLDALTTEVGGRWSRQTYTDLEQGVAFSPRLNAVLQLTDATTISLSWGDFRQPQAIDELSPGDGDTQFHPDQIAEHHILGVRHTPNSHFKIRLDLYQKDYTQLLPRYENLYANIERFVHEASRDRVAIAPDRAKARGVELGLHYDSHARFSAWANYSYSEVNDYIEGYKIPRAWDQRHAGNVSLNWDQNDWSFNLTAMFRSGWPTTSRGISAPQSHPAAPTPAPDFERYQTERLGGYTRIDIRVMKRMALPDGGSFQYYFEIYNLLDTSNPLNVEGDSWLPRMPSFGMRFVF